MIRIGASVQRRRVSESSPRCTRVRWARSPERAPTPGNTLLACFQIAANESNRSRGEGSYFRCYKTSDGTELGWPQGSASFFGSVRNKLKSGLSHMPRLPRPYTRAATDRESTLAAALRMITKSRTTPLAYARSACARLDGRLGHAFRALDCMPHRGYPSKHSCTSAFTGLAPNLIGQVIEAIYLGLHRVPNQ